MSVAIIRPGPLAMVAGRLLADVSPVGWTHTRACGGERGT